MAQWLERGASTMSLPVVRFQTLLGAGCSDKCHVSQYRCCVLGQGTLPSHASLDSGVNEYLHGRAEMVMCAIS